ncbi:MAG TPA: hypothetical protein EYQ83_08325 [Acidobacteria bacterium]|nr:hypothetical protein [Acidobacteriota bacterium]
MHTTHSDGSGQVADVEAAAAAVGLDFVIVTDHNSLAAKPSEGYGRTGVLTVVGTEISNRGGHLLAVGLPQLTYRFSGDARDSLRDLAELGSVSFAAHPESGREDLRWQDWDLPGSWGVEILNGDSQRRAAGWAGGLAALARYPLNSDYALLRLLRRPAALDRWDGLLSRRHATGITGADAHGTLRRTVSAALPFPTYEAVFRIAQNYVLLERPFTGNVTQDTAALVAALTRGRLYVGIGALAPADRFFFLAERAGEQWTMGDEVPAAGPLRLRAGGALPATARLTLLRDGVVVTAGERVIDQRVDEPGVYRVEAHLDGWDVPWIVSNPIYVLTQTDRARRRAAAALPGPVVVGATAELERFDTSSRFTAVSDPSTTLDPRFIDPGTGPDGSSAARIAFQLGVPTADHPSPFASLGSYEPRDLSGRNGLVFSVRSDVPYRFWVQVRDLNPTEPEGANTWQASVRSSTEWRNVTVPFERLRNVIDDADGTLDLAETQAILFLVDTGAVPPGTDGTIWIDDLRVY